MSKAFWYSISNKFLLLLLLNSIAEGKEQKEEWILPAYKPGSVEWLPTRTVIPLGVQSPTPSSSLPAAS